MNSTTQTTLPMSLNVAITGLTFFFDATLDHPELMRNMHPVYVPHKLPVVLSRDEVARLIKAAGNLKNKTVLSVACGAELRASEVVAPKAKCSMVAGCVSKCAMIRISTRHPNQHRLAPMLEAIAQR
jgi:site-specific recombinase XerD